MVGHVGWSPEIFWKATPYESSCAYIGHCQKNATGYYARSPTGWSQASIDEFKDDIAAAKLRFADR